MVLRWLLIALHAVLSVAAVVAGAMLVADPSGKRLTFEVEWLQGSPFKDYRLPGLFLAIVIGSSNLVSAVGLTRRHPLAPVVSLATGLNLVVWISIQTWIIGLRDWRQVGWIITFLGVTALAIREVRRSFQRAAGSRGP
jgi:hypothetical protein